MERPRKTRQSRDRRGEDSSAMTKVVGKVLSFVRMAEFEILFFLFFVIALLIFKDLTSRPEYNQIMVRRPGKVGFFPLG